MITCFLEDSFNANVNKYNFHQTKCHYVHHRFLPSHSNISPKVCLLLMASMALALPHKPPGGSGIDGQYHPVYDHGHGPGGGEPTLHHVRALARARVAHAHAHAHAFGPYPPGPGPYHPGYFKRAAGERRSFMRTVMEKVSKISFHPI